MILVVTLDNKNGMLFNKRRQSRDKVLIEDLKVRVGNNRLLISSYSEELFDEKAIVCENPMEVARQGDYVFVETDNIKPYANKIEKVWIYKWNRDYPGDVFFPLNIINSNVICEFTGSSHEKITLEEAVL